MSQITSLLNGENINHDHQITALHKALINPGIISGLVVTAGQVAVGEAFIECTRSNGEKIMVHFMNTAPLNIDTSGNKKIFIEVKQEHIDNGMLNAEDGSNIAEIKSGANYPSKNFISLASVTGGVIVDERKFISQKYAPKNIPDIRGQGKAPKDYNSQTFYGPEFVEGATVGITEVSWINLHTYCSWKNLEWQYTTQLAITSQGNPGIWIRKAKNQDEWEYWQKVFPFSATALDIHGLPETSISTNAYDFFLIKEFTGGNKKVTLENLRKWIIPRSSNVIHTPIKNSTSQSYAIPNGALAIVQYHGIPRASGWTRVHTSDNNSYWTQKYEYSTSGDTNPNSVIFPVMLPPGFVKFQHIGSETSAQISMHIF